MIFLNPSECGDPLSRQVLERLPLEQYHKAIILADQGKGASSHSATTTAMFIRHIQVHLCLTCLIYSGGSQFLYLDIAHLGKEYKVPSSVSSTLRLAIVVNFSIT